MPSLPSRAPVNGVASPWGVWMLVLAVISVTEYGIMLALPIFLYHEPPRLLESFLDSLILSAALSPVLWWWVVRPLHQAAEQRERFLADLFATIEDERRRIARELHDGVGQSLTLVISGLRSLPESADAQNLQRRNRSLQEFAEQALGEVKQLCLDLRPSLLDDLGLAAAIERVAADLQAHDPLKISVDDERLQGMRLPEKVETALFRIFQEAINNVVKHASAQRAVVRLTREPHDVVLEVQDDGRGLDFAALDRQTQTGRHLGLIGMRERAAHLGGELTVDSRPGQGTRIAARIPLKAPAP